MYFKKIIIVGSGDIACKCTKFLHDKKYTLVVFETNASQLSLLHYYSKKNKIEYYNVSSKNELENKIFQKVNCKTLLISANNLYIFDKILEVKDLVAINFHYGLLPYYRGMNIPTWVIYNEEQYTGPTWHYVNKQIDQGEIISQKRIQILESDTALSITKKTMKEGELLFYTFIDNLLRFGETKNLKTTTTDKTYKLYLKNIIPMNGILDINLESKKILTLLRAYNYGPLEYVPKLQVEINNNLFTITGYTVNKSKTKLNYTIQDENHIIINNNNIFLVIKLKR